MFSSGSVTMKFILVLASTLPLLLAAPAPASALQPSSTLRQPANGTAATTSSRTTHTVVAGRPGLRFDPDNIVASPGSIIEFHFLPANHSVVEASFASPCRPKDADSFFSGFFPVAKTNGSVAQSADVFQVEVRDNKPIWFYCAQNKGRHCQSGMVGVVNSGNTTNPILEVFRRNAAAVNGSAGVQRSVQGGWRGRNPNPLRGL